MSHNGTVNHKATIDHRETIRTPKLPCVAVQDSCLDLPTSLSLRKERTASVQAPFPISSLTAVLFGHAFVSRTLCPNRLLLLGVCPLCLSPSCPPGLLLPEMFPTSSHGQWISPFHLLHSSNRCSRLCLPPWHHQHWSDSIHLHFSLRKGAIIACPLSSW